jgi:DNA-directed RNA polymerase subunit beta
MDEKKFKKCIFWTERYNTVSLPNLLKIQFESFNWFLNQGLREVLEEYNPIESSRQGLALYFLTGENDIKILEPSKSPDECLEKGLTYESPLYINVMLIKKEIDNPIIQSVFFGNIPRMTERATFIINGTERVIVNQITRSPGIYFQEEGHSIIATLIPTRGGWIEFEIDNNGLMYIHPNGMKKFLLSILLKALGYDLNFFEKILSEDDFIFLKNTFEKDGISSRSDAIFEACARLRPSDVPSKEKDALEQIKQILFDVKRYNLGRVGRYKVNQRLKLNIPLDNYAFTEEDLIEIVKHLIWVKNGKEEADDIDHLGNRRIRSVGELLQIQFRTGLSRVEKIIKERMALQGVEEATPQNLISTRPLVSAIREFFNRNPLSQFMDQTNPLSELAHKRRISALGPGGLTRERASFEVRDIHPSYYGRICPIETPEGPNAGLINYLATLSIVDEYGFLRTPYLRVKNGKITNEIVYLSASEEEEYTIASFDVHLNKENKIIDKLVNARRKGKFILCSPEAVDFIGVSPYQTVSISTALIPFLEHDDANRALMGANMQRQAVPLINSEPPLVQTGIEELVAKNTGVLVISDVNGVVKKVTSSEIVIETENKETKTFNLIKYRRTNQGTCWNQKPIVKVGDIVKKGDILADGPSTSQGILSLGRNVLVAFLPWGGYNYEDAIIISERLVKEDIFTSIHIEEYEVKARDTKLGPEEITRDIPNISEEAIRYLDKDGIIMIGAEVGPNDILVGKVTPKGETELTPEERLLRAIFGEKSREIRDTSLRMPHGEWGKVIDVKVLTREDDELPPGVNKIVKVRVAQIRKISVGDKLAGRHGNKGVIATILPEEDMPYLEDGTPVDIILNPLGVPSRMNVGQILETHLGWAAKELGIYAIVPPFDEFMEENRSANLVKEMLKKAGLPEDGKVTLYDGRTGEPFDQKVTVGYMYIMKLIHLADDKIHARSVGPYSLVTQQPLGGRAQFGGQRFGEMEVWALEAYGAAHILEEILTYKSDDIKGRTEVFSAIINASNIKEPGIPESFKVLVRELQGLGIKVSAYVGGKPINLYKVEAES